jgi:signal peptidase I
MIRSKFTKETWKEIFSWVKTIGFALIFAWCINRFIIVNASVPSDSMLNTIERGRIVAFRLSYTFGEPQRYDIVVFRYPDDENVLYVKRIVGMPGETLEIRNGEVFVTCADGIETKTDDHFLPAPPRGNFGPVTIPEGSYFMLGDNRNNSEDSRMWRNTFMDKDKILGKVQFSYYPKIRRIK